MYLVFDTETTGLPIDWRAPMTNVENWPRVIQLAWALYDENHQLIREQCYLIKPDGWVMPTGEFWQKHGYTQETSMNEGRPIYGVLCSFLTDLNRCRYFIAHNAEFDYNVVGAEMIRAQLKAEKRQRTRICTKIASTTYCAIPNGRGAFKWPRLDELHNKLFNSGFDGAHDALNDVRACARCFFELKRLNIITLQ